MKRNAPFALALVVLLPLAAACRPAAESPAGDAQAPSDGHEEERVVHLPPALAERAGIDLATAGPGRIAVRRELPGEVRPNGNRLAHVAPRVGGVAREVHASLGDRVRGGQLLAVLESRELAEARAAWLAARERRDLREETFRREDRLRRRGVSAEQDWLDARAALAEAEIELRAARQALLALGISPRELEELPSLPEADLRIHRIVAPFSGEVLARHITPGEAIAALSPVFTVADLSTVWVDLSVYPRDLPFIRPGAPVTIVAGNAQAAGKISFILPLLGEETRTALARVVLPNRDETWRPGTFVTGRVTVEEAEVDVRVPLAALLHPPGGGTAVFVAEGEERFVLRPVEVGRRDEQFAEIVAGLVPGERYVARNAFSLLAELQKSEFGDDHDH